MAQAQSRLDELGGTTSPPKIKLGERASKRKLAEDSGEKVTVGCKIPSGLLLQLYEPSSVTTPVLGGGVREEKIYRPLAGESIRLNGCRAPWGEHPGHEMKHGAGLTFNVPKAFMDEWLRQNEDSPLVLNGTITIERDRKSLVDLLKDEKDRRSGLEPITPDTDPRIPRNKFGKPAIVTKNEDDE